MLPAKFDTVAGQVLEIVSKLVTFIDIAETTTARVDFKQDNHFVRGKKNIRSKRNEEFKEKLHTFDQSFSLLFFQPLFAPCTVGLLARAIEGYQVDPTLNSFIQIERGMMFSFRIKDSKGLLWNIIRIEYAVSRSDYVYTAMRTVRQDSIHIFKQEMPDATQYRQLQYSKYTHDGCIKMNNTEWYLLSLTVKGRVRILGDALVRRLHSCIPRFLRVCQILKSKKRMEEGKNRFRSDCASDKMDTVRTATLKPKDIVKEYFKVYISERVFRLLTALVF